MYLSLQYISICFLVLLEDQSNSYFTTHNTPTPPKRITTNPYKIVDTLNSEELEMASQSSSRSTQTAMSSIPSTSSGSAHQRNLARIQAEIVANHDDRMFETRMAELNHEVELAQQELDEELALLEEAFDDFFVKGPGPVLPPVPNNSPASTESGSDGSAAIGECTNDIWIEQADEFAQYSVNERVEAWLAGVEESAGEVVQDSHVHSPAASVDSFDEFLSGMYDIYGDEESVVGSEDSFEAFVDAVERIEESLADPEDTAAE